MKFDSLKKITPTSLKEILKDFTGHNFISNYFRSDFDKNVLISYVNKPFLLKKDYRHTNFGEAVAIANVFNSLGYNVDLINFTKFKRFNPRSYDVVFGLGEAVEFALQSRTPGERNPFVIWHGTGSNPFFSNPITIKRLEYSYRQTGQLMIESTRFLDKIYPLSYVYSDLIILYGNEFTKNTYRDYTYSPIETISPTTYFSVPSKDLQKKTNTDYLWFGSAGAIHKGLDLLLDYFINHPHLNLHICGDLVHEARFYKMLDEKIRSRPNIRYYGFVDIMSKKFANLMELCTFSVLPSCSEGIATSVLTTMSNGGMIPIVTLNAGIDLHDYGILIEEVSLHGIGEAIEKSQQLSIEEITKRSGKIFTFSKENYTIENFSINLMNILTKYLNQ